MKIFPGGRGADPPLGRGQLGRVLAVVFGYIVRNICAYAPVLKGNFMSMEVMREILAGKLSECKFLTMMPYWKTPERRIHFLILFKLVKFLYLQHTVDCKLCLFYHCHDTLLPVLS
jgi:hypothetical protein